MSARESAPRTVDEYIAMFPEDVQRALRRIRATIRKAAPAAEEKISYQIPTFTLNGNLISFAAYKRHIGLYPSPSGSEEFNRQLSAYRAEKSTIRFPLGEPIPLDLITQVVKLRMKDNLKRAQAKAGKKRA